MIKELIYHQFLPQEIDLAEQASLHFLEARRSAGLKPGGVSRIFRDRPATNKWRESRTVKDSVVGNLGCLLAYMYFFGQEDGVIRFWNFRMEQDKFPSIGDKGSDIKDYQIDVKTSFQRAVINYPEIKTGNWTKLSEGFEKYHLLVRPTERHKNTAYILAIIAKDSKEGTWGFLLGWASEHELPQKPFAGGPLAGAYGIPASKLHPCSELDLLFWQQHQTA